MVQNSLIAKTIYAQQTQRLGELFAQGLGRYIGNAPLVFAITGDPKSGKTTFIRGLAKGFGVSIEEISSSSGLIGKYQGTHTVFYHIDPHGLTVFEPFWPDLAAIFKEQNCVIAVEQANVLKQFLPDNAIWLHIVDLKGTERALILYPTRNLPIPEAFETLRRIGIV